MATATVLTNAGAAVVAKRMVGATPSQLIPAYCAMGTGGSTAAVTDTALTTEVETRTLGTQSTVTTTVTNDTYQCVGTITATASRSIIEAGLLDASSTGALMISATFAAQSLLNGDSIQFTWKYKAVAG